MEYKQILEIFSKYFRNILEIIWRLFWNYFGTILEIILELFWKYFGNYFGQYLYRHER